MSKPAENPVIIDLDALEKSATELLASSELMAKAGMNPLMSSHVDERGEVSPTMASESDAGSIENLMIGKATNALRAAGFANPTPAMIGQMVGFMEEMEEEEEEDPAYAKSEAAAARDFLAQFNASPTIREVQAEPVIAEIVGVISKALGRMSFGQAQFMKSQADFNGKLAKAVQAVGRETVALRKSSQSMTETLGITARAPAAAPVGVRTPEVAMAKSGGAPPAAGDALTKGQVCSVLGYMAISKGERHVNGIDLLGKSALFQGGASVTQDAYQVAINWLKHNPGEREFALAYNATR